MGWFGWSGTCLSAVCSFAHLFVCVLFVCSLDEAHRIKNASGAIRHSLDRVQGNMRLLLTGTPLQNNAQELFTLINFLMPDVFRDSLVIEQVWAIACLRFMLALSVDLCMDLRGHAFNSNCPLLHARITRHPVHE